MQLLWRHLLTWRKVIQCCIDTPLGGVYRNVPSFFVYPTHSLSYCILKLEPNQPHILAYSFSSTMATKTQAMAGLLLLSLLFCIFTSGQLVTTLSEVNILHTVELGVCGVVLNLIKIDGLTGPLNTTCCNLFSALTSQQASSCLCIAIKLGFLGLNVTIPGDIGILLTYCGKQVPLLTCS
ncbi:unnamed protein product [Spirodela intermedia]|uniref:Hydrophobic seed protein domain-containing protein n=1 Tax=Spirodela intermedia TaxID=51605 RepID=A0A7I8KQ92_SPIIN|nr:unnamed protein product [Spirodela intermedia]